MDYAFTDSMIRADREVLTNKALQYLASYTGEFEPLIKAKRAIEEGFELGVAQIRVVLNSMRADTSIQLNYQPVAGTNVVNFPRRPGIRFNDPFGEVPEQYQMPKPEPRRRMLKRFAIKTPYCMSMKARSEVIHMVSPERTECWYYPIGSWNDGEKVYGQPIWEFRIKYECTGSTSPALRMLSELEAEVLVEVGAMRFCKWCPALAEQRKSA